MSSFKYVVMPNKQYALTAWTEKGQVRMIPSLINDLSIPYRETIESLSARKQGQRETDWLLELSRAHEDFARFLLRVGRPLEAYTEFENAANECLRGHWSAPDKESGKRGLNSTLRLRFLAMHQECLDLADGNSFLRRRYEGSNLQWDFRRLLVKKQKDLIGS